MVIALAAALISIHQSGEVYFGGKGPGEGKRIVLLSGDEEYRSEEGLPQLARILSTRHGFHCTVLFSINARGEIDPTTKDNEPGLSALHQADLCIILLRFRQWPDSQMQHFVDYYRSGKPIIALRTSTHAFEYGLNSRSKYAEFGWSGAAWKGGFGREVLGETWISHWGIHGQQGTRGILEAEQAANPILRGVNGIFGTTDVYEAAPPHDATVLVRGQVVAGMSPYDLPAFGRKQTAQNIAQDLNAPMMPIVWTRNRLNENGKTNFIVTCTMGAATDLLNTGLRRLIVNSAYVATGLTSSLPTQANVDLVGDYHPSAFGFDKHIRGRKPTQFLED